MWVTWGKPLLSLLISLQWQRPQHEQMCLIRPRADDQHADQAAFHDVKTSEFYVENEFLLLFLPELGFDSQKGFLIWHMSETCHTVKNGLNCQILSKTKNMSQNNFVNFGIQVNNISIEMDRDVPRRIRVRTRPVSCLHRWFQNDYLRHNMA